MEINTDYYIDNLETFLHRLKKEVTDWAFWQNHNKSDLAEIDEYIHELNSFYYHSFHDNFFPAYKNSVNQEISKLLKLGAENRSLKKYVLASIKRYAKLYNQVKKINKTLTDMHIDYSQKIFGLAQVQEKQNLELYYSIKKLEGFLLRFNSHIESVTNLLADKQLIARKANLFEYCTILNIISHQEPDNVLLTDAANKLIIHLHNILNLLQRLKNNCQSKQVVEEVRAEIRNQDLFSLSDGSIHLKKFYETEISKKLLLYLDFISSHFADNPRVQKAIAEVTEWLGNLLIVLQKAISYSNLPEGKFLNSLAQISDLPANYVAKIRETSFEAAASVDLLVNELTNTEKLVFPSVHLEILAIIEKSHPVFVQAAKEPYLIATGPLYSLINQAKQELSFLKLQVGFLNQNNEHAVKIAEYHNNLISSLGSHRELVSNIQSDLQRLLAPRNITRTYKDIAIKIDHIALEKGKAFPPNYLYLLDKHYIETRPTANENNTVLHEEGDIFIINVEGEIEEEIPYIIIGRKG